MDDKLIEKLGPYAKEVQLGHEAGLKDPGYVRNLERNRRIAALRRPARDK